MRIACAVLFLSVACGGQPDDVEQEAQVSNGQLAQPCREGNGCDDGLTCKGARGVPLCLPSVWFTGKVGSFCDRDADCAKGLVCDTGQAPQPFVDGLCRGLPND